MSSKFVAVEVDADASEDTFVEAAKAQYRELCAQERRELKKANRELHLELETAQKKLKLQRREVEWGRRDLQFPSPIVVVVSPP